MLLAIDTLVLSVKKLRELLTIEPGPVENEETLGASPDETENDVVGADSDPIDKLGALWDETVDEVAEDSALLSVCFVAFLDKRM